MTRSWFRKLFNRSSKTSRPASGRSRRPATWTLPLSLERLEDRTLLDGTAGAGQLFNLSSSSNNGTVYLQENTATLYIQCSTDNVNWINVQSVAGTGQITIDPTALQSALG